MVDSKANGGSASRNGHGANPHHEKSNGATNMSATKKSTPAPLGKAAKPKKMSKLGSLMALRKASKRPLPTQMGDGSYQVITQRPGIRQDLGRIGLYGGHMRF